MSINQVASGLSGAKRRELTFLVGVGAAAIAKTSSAASQVIAIPLGIRAIGVDEYAAYAIILALGAWASLLVLSFGPKLVATVAVDRGNVDRFRQTLSVAVLNVSVVFAAGLFVVLNFDMHSQFPVLKQAFDEGRMDRFLLLVVGFNLVNALLAVPEAFQVAYQKHYVQSGYTFIGNCIAVLCVVLIIPVKPFAESLFFCVFLPQAVFRTLNAVLFVRSEGLLSRRPQLAMSGDDNKRTASDQSSLIRYALAYTCTAVIAAYLINQFPVLLFSQFSSNVDVVTYSILLTILGLLVQPLGLLCWPLLPAIADGIRVADFAWVARTAKLFLGIVAFYALLTLGLLGIFGPTILKYWSSEIEVSSVLMWMFACYASIVCIEVSIFQMVHVVGSVRKCYVRYLLRVGLTALFCFAAAFVKSLEVYFIAALLVTLFISVVPTTWDLLASIAKLRR